MRALVVCLSLFAACAVADTVFKNAGARLGPVTSINCSADAGISCSRTASTGTGNLSCSSASATELGCVSTSAQTLSGQKTFTGGVRAPTFGGADGGVYVKTSDGASLVGAGVWSVHQPYGVLTQATAVVPGVFGITDGTTGLASSVKITGVLGVALVDGEDTDGGPLSIDGGSKGYWLTLSAVDDAGSRFICSSFQICNSGTGLLHQRSDFSCGADGGGIVNRNGFIALAIAAYDQSGALMTPECEVPAVNYFVNYTGIP